MSVTLDCFRVPIQFAGAETGEGGGGGGELCLYWRSWQCLGFEKLGLGLKSATIQYSPLSTTPTLSWSRTVHKPGTDQRPEA